MIDALRNLKAILIKIEQAEISYSEEIEQHYEALLTFLKANEDKRRELGKELVSIVKSYRYSRTGQPIALSIDGLAYCMRELRWNEVEAATDQEIREYFGQRMDNTLGRLLDSFRDD